MEHRRKSVFAGKGVSFRCLEFEIGIGYPMEISQGAVEVYVIAGT